MVECSIYNCSLSLSEMTQMLFYSPLEILLLGVGTYTILYYF